MNLSSIADKTIPSPAGKAVVHYNDGDTGDIMQEVLDCFSDSKNQLQRFAPYLKGDDLLGTCANIWRFVKNNIAYQVDPIGEQWIKEPVRTWYDKICDCKSYSVFIASLLHCLGIKGSFRFVSFNAKNDTPTHVYVVVRQGKKLIILDGVMPVFNAEKPYKYKHDYNMTRISRLSGFDQTINGGLLQNVTVAPARRKVLQDALPGLAINALYQWIPAGPGTQQGYKEIVSLLSTPDNLLSKCPDIVKQKRMTSLRSFWDFGAWANIKVETDVFPQLRTYLTQMLGMDPATWWRKRLSGVNGIGLDPEAAAGAIQQAGSFLKGITNALKGLFGGTDIRWNYGDPSVWGPNTDDWSNYGVNPLASLNLGFNTGTGAITPTNYTAIPPVPVNNGGGGAPYNGNSLPTNTNPGTTPVNASFGGMSATTMTLLGGGALLLWIANKK